MRALATAFASIALVTPAWADSTYAQGDAGSRPAIAPAEPTADPALPRPGSPPLVVFRGNILFNQYVYRALLDLPADAQADAATAERVRLRIASFLWQAGYELAQVRAEVQGGQIVVDLVEGQLDKIVVLGVGAWDSVRFHLDLDLPADVYNRPLLEESLARLCRRYRLQRCTSSLVDVDPLPDNPLGPGTLQTLEVSGASAFLPQALVRAARAHELQIHLEQSPRHSGFWPTVDVGEPDGLVLGATGHLAELPLRGGWTDLKLAAGANVREHLDGSGTDLVLSRAVGGVRLSFPSLWDTRVRPTVGLLADLVSRQRRDLGVDSLMQARLEAVVAADFIPRPGLDLGGGVGLARSLIFGVRTLAPVDPVVAATPSALLRPFALAFARTDLSSDELRWDRHHRLDLQLRLRDGSSGVGRGVEVQGDGRYQKYIGLGWHELWFRAHGQLRVGDVLYTEESPLSDDLHGAFGNTWVDNSLSVLTEFRFSLVRDLLKVSAFGAVDLFDRIQQRTPLDAQLTGAVAAGLGLHGLVLTVVTVNLYGTVAWTTDGRFGPGLALEIHEAYR